MGTFVKICGITSLEAALACARGGADAIGFVFAKSRRRVSVAEAKRISLGLPGGLYRVGVFVDMRPDYVLEVAGEVCLTHLQLHGSESPAQCEYLRDRRLPVIKALRVRNTESLKRMASYDVDAFLLDSYVPGRVGGTGTMIDLDLLGRLGTGSPIIVAGGLDSGNVPPVIRAVRPYGVDVSSGVERNGVKAADLILDFIRAVREAEMETGSPEDLPADSVVRAQCHPRQSHDSTRKGEKA
ncbi:MAG: phosphoribosylanthranilate isomerase [Bacillota bacterium]|jgi:phosphoribosylanthranilate isomerase